MTEKTNAMIAVYNTHIEAETGIKELPDAAYSAYLTSMNNVVAF